MGTIGERYHALARDTQEVLKKVKEEPLLVQDLTQTPTFKSLEISVSDAVKRGYE